MTIKQILMEANAIQINIDVANWQEAIEIAAAPLISGGYIHESYKNEVIKNTEDYGPYYVFGDEGLAIPHARPDSGVIKNGFSLVLLNKPISIKGSDAVDILVMFGATNSNEHIKEGLVEIVEMLDDKVKMDRLRNAESIDEVIKIL